MITHLFEWGDSVDHGEPDLLGQLTDTRPGRASTLRAWSAATLRAAPPRWGPAYWSAAPSPVPTRPPASDMAGTSPAAPRCDGAA